MQQARAFLLNDTSITGHPGCVSVMAAIRQNMERRSIQVMGSWPVGLDWNYGLQNSRKFKAASFFIVNGEGTLHNSKTRGKARNLLELARLIKSSTGKPVFLVNATIENIEDEHMKLLHHFDRIFVRDSQSRSYLKASGIEANLVPDLSLSAEFNGSPKTGVPVVTDSVVPSTTAVLKKCSESVHARFLPMRPPKLRSYLHWALNSPALAQNARNFYAAIAGADWVVSGRFHATLFCVLAGAPFLAVESNTKKIQSTLLDIFCNADRMIGIDDLKHFDGKVPPLTDEELQRSKKYIENARSLHRSMFDQIVASAAQPGKVSNRK
jgi:polysaccharide pyruvyl transferase WcaK-like protein